MYSVIDNREEPRMPLCESVHSVELGSEKKMCRTQERFAGQL